MYIVLHTPSTSYLFGLFCCTTIIHLRAAVHLLWILIIAQGEMQQIAIYANFPTNIAICRGVEILYGIFVGNTDTVVSTRDGVEKKYTIPLTLKLTDMKINDTVRDENFPGFSLRGFFLWYFRKLNGKHNFLLLWHQKEKSLTI